MTHASVTHASAGHGAAHDQRARRALIVLLLMRLLLGFAYSAINPLGEAPDEADHYAYAVAIGRESRLPVGPEMTQAKHPPAYHLLAALAGRPAGLDVTFLRSNPDVSVPPVDAPNARGRNFFIHTAAEAWPWRGGPLAMHLARLVSVLAGVGLVAATYGIGRRLWSAQPHVAVMAAALVAFLPESLFIAGSVSNDMLAALLSALALLAALRARADVRRLADQPAQASFTKGAAGSTAGGPAALQTPSSDKSTGRLASRPLKGAGGAALTGVFMALAFLTKASCVALWPVAVALLVLPADARALRTMTEWRGVVARLPLGIVAALVAVAGVAPWLVRNWRLYGDPMGTRLVLATIDQRGSPLTLADLGWLFRGWFLSFWGKFGGAGHIALPVVFYVIWGVIMAAAILGALRAARRAPQARRTASAPWLILGAAPLLTALAMIGYTRVALGTDQGRLLFPALAAIALLIAWGLAGWLPPGSNGRHDRAAAIWAAGLLLTAVAALFAGIVAPFAPPAAPAPAAVAAAQAANVTWGDVLTLVAVDWPDIGAPAVGAPADGAPADGAPANEVLTLYWRAAAPITLDLRTVVRILGADGAVVWEWRRSPGAGRFSTDRWPVSRFVADAYPVPAEAAAAARRVEIGVYAFGGADLPLRAGGTVATEERFFIFEMAPP